MELQIAAILLREAIETSCKPMWTQQTALSRVDSNWRGKMKRKPYKQEL